MKPIIQYPRAGLPLVSYPVSAIAQRYGFPRVQQQTQWVAVISLGGGFSATDVKAYCQRYSMPVPPMRFISIDGATNDYTGDPGGADGENALDVQTITGASGGQLGILFYGAKNDGKSFAKAVRQVALDNVACACSISWGSPESAWAAIDRTAMDDAVQLCLSKLIWVTVASGDAGSSDGLPGNTVDYPSACPWVLGVGGTTITPTGENAWSYGGGGLSRLYARPSSQLIGGNARGVPDWSANANPQTGYDICIGGQWGAVGGTSAGAPLLATGIALATSVLGKRIANLPAILYRMQASFTDITTGSNGAYRAVAGWDPCTGLGTTNSAFWQALIASQQTQPPTPTPTPVPTPTPAPTTVVLPALAGGIYQRIGA